VVPDFPKIVGGMAVEAIESWVASLDLQTAAESATDPSAFLADPCLAGQCAIVEAADLSKLSPDAKSLRQWLIDVAGLFGVRPSALFDTSET
jgi:hypothetical protein